MGTMTAAPSPKASAAPSKAPVGKLPFAKGAVRHIEQVLDTTVTMGTSTVPISPVDIPAVGFARDLIIDVQITSAGNSATVALQPDAPWSLFAELALTDTSSTPFIGPLLGHNAYLVHKYGGYRRQMDPKRMPDFVTPLVGAGATAGTGRFQLRIPIEVNARDAFGSLYNGNSATPYRLRQTINTLASVFSTAPTVAPTVRVRVYLEAWFPPDAADAYGRPQEQVPPGNGTTQFWTQLVSASLSAGFNTLPIKKTGLSLRNMIFIFRDNSGVRQASQVPSDLSLYVDTRPLFTTATTPLRMNMAEAFEFITPTAEGISGPDNGVIAWTLADDLDGTAGYETREQYLLTSQGTRMELQCTMPAAGTITVLVNDVSAANGVIL